MSTRDQIVRRNNKVALVIEVCYSTAEPRQWWQIFVSRPGSESVKHHTWITDPEGFLPASSYNDMAGLVDGYIIHAIGTRGGIQGELGVAWLGDDVSAR